MRKILSVILCAALLLPVLFRSSSVNAYPGDPFRNRNAQAESGILVYVDYYDGKTEKYHKEVPVTYDAQGRILDDGLTYHLYDKTGHEIMISNPMYQFPYFGDLHIGNSTEPRIQYNADGTPSNYARSYRNVRFGYNSKGSIKTIEQYQNDFVEYRFTYTYSGNQIRKITLDDYSGGAGGKTAYTFSYENDRLSKIHSVREDGGKSYHYETDAVYTYQNDRLKSVVYSGQEGTVYEAAYYSYDGSGRVTVLETYSFDKGEEGWKVYYQYPEEPETEAPTEKPTEKATEKPTEEDGEEVEIDHFFPESGLTGERFTDHIEIFFKKGTIIKTVNYNSFRISMCDAATGKEVYSVGKGSDTKIYDSTFQIRDNWFYWKLPSPSLDTNPFQAGHTYYLKMEEGFLSFSKSNQKFRIDDPKEWHYKVRLEYTFKWNDFGDTKESYFDYKDSFFAGSAYDYVPKLATMSMCASMAAYNAVDRKKGYSNICELFERIDFGNIYYNADYKNTPTSVTTGIAIASKPLKEGTTLVAVAVRGGAYEDEWAGDFAVGLSGDHEGFTVGKQKVLQALKDYFTRGKGRYITGHIKIWIFGYSRGAAIANLSAAALDRGYDLGGRVSYEAKDVFAYCFEVPNNTVDPDYYKSLYHNIYNVRNPIDPVTMVPLEKWGFHIYGNILKIPAYGLNSEFWTYKDKVSKGFRSMYSKANLLQVGNAYELVMQVKKDLGKKIRTREKYVSKYQSTIMNFWTDSGRQDLSNLKSAFKGDNSGKLAAVMSEIDALDPDLKGLAWFALNFVLGKEAASAEGARFLAFAANSENFLETVKSLIYPHFPTLTLTWMRVLENTGYLESTIPWGQISDEGFSELWPSGSFFSFHCPVNVTAYNAANVKIAELKDGTEFVEENASIAAFYTADGSMNFYIPALTQVRFEIKPYADGKMTLTIENTDLDSGESKRTVVYPDLTVEKNKKLTMNVKTGFSASDYQAVFKDEGGKSVDSAYEITPETEEYYEITLKTSGNGAAYGGGEAVKGAFTELYAVPQDDDTVFTGWFDEKGTLITTDAVLSYRGWNDAVLEARFEKKDRQTAPTEPATESKPAPETKPDGGSDRKEPDSPLIPIMILLILPGLAAVIIGIILLNKNRKKR